jgi:hypothetical protein
MLVALTVPPMQLQDFWRRRQSNFQTALRTIQSSIRLAEEIEDVMLKWSVEI